MIEKGVLMFIEFKVLKNLKNFITNRRFNVSKELAQLSTINFQLLKNL